MDHSHPGKFAIPAIHHFIPEPLKPWIVILLVLCFQLSGGVYLAAVSEMVGSLALRQEDILMAGYASMIGMSLTFTIMFRLKFAIRPKRTLLLCAAALIVCNLICMHTDQVPILVITCFFAGIFRMWATFECNSTIQLWLTPKRDMSIFFSYVYLLVQGCIQLSGLTTVYVSLFAKWEYMHWMVIGLLLFVMLTVMLLYNDKRFIRKLPLFGIDWLGAALWAVTMLSILFVSVYGEHYDWWESKWIVLGTITIFVSLLLNIWRASFIRHPFIANVTWKYPVIWITATVYMVFDLLIAPGHLLEHLYMGAILNYDEQNIIALNWVVLAGVVTGAYFTYRVFAIKKTGYQKMTAIAFSAVTLHLLFFYFSIDYHLPKETLVVPIFLRSFGYVTLAICFITALTRIPFIHFFQGVTIQGFVSAGIGGTIANAIFGRAFNTLLPKNYMLLSSTTDAVSNHFNREQLANIYGTIQKHAMIVTMKELYGWLSIVGLLCILLFLVKKSEIRPLNVLHPTYKTLRKIFSAE